MPLFTEFSLISSAIKPYQFLPINAAIRSCEFIKKIAFKSVHGLSPFLLEYCPMLYRVISHETYQPEIEFRIAGQLCPEGFA